jgi:hypothetical protein
MAGNAATILVTGDVFVDWGIVAPADVSDRVFDLSRIATGDPDVKAVAMPGGAARAAQILGAVLGRRSPDEPPVDVIGPVVPPEALSSPFDDRVARSFSLIARFPRSVSKREPEAWRISQVWGVRHATHPDPLQPSCGERTIDVLAIQDIGLAYRRTPETWPDIGTATPRHIVISTMAPLDDNRLLTHLLETAADRLTVIVTSTDLRSTGSKIGYPLSWERTAEEVDAAVRALPIAGAATAVVLLELSGAVVVRRDGPTTLAYDPMASEGSWRREHPGEMVGHTLAYLAALSCAVAGRDRADVADAARRSVAASRALHLTGLVATDGPQGETLTFPADAVARALTEDPHEIIATYHPRPDGRQSIVAGALGHESVLEAARQLALGGPASLPLGIPVETIGAWSSVDRMEIETLRSVGLVLDEYRTRFLSSQPLGRPLSVAVFGPPGSGKSFAVKETIRHKLGKKVRILEFNLSQFDDASELTAAFHQIRDAVLEQRLPLVFWDEFDTTLEGRRLGWLRHFLAPMQDGKFREGEAFRPIGPAIFVFAGGTTASFAEFATVSEAEAETAAKKPDFISRLRGYVDILGPNKRSGDDDAVVLRRALLLRSLLLRQAPQIVAGSGPNATLRIDPGLLRAFLLVGKYRHGARSVEALIEMSALSGRMQYELASLPAPHLLDLHVDADEFLTLAEG